MPWNIIPCLTTKETPPPAQSSGENPPPRAHQGGHWENESDNQKFLQRFPLPEATWTKAKNWHDTRASARDDLLLVAKLAIRRIRSF